MLTSFLKFRDKFEINGRYIICTKDDNNILKEQNNFSIRMARSIFQDLNYYP
jgi:hypothetical protein